MPQQEPIDISQSEENLLSDIAEQERKKLFPRNDYNTKNQYSATNKDALADGDELGRGILVPCRVTFLVSVTYTYCATFYHAT